MSPTCVTGEGRRSEGHVPSKSHFIPMIPLAMLQEEAIRCDCPPNRYTLQEYVEEDSEPYQQLRNFEALVACPKWYRFPYVNSAMHMLSKLSAHTAP